MRQIKETLYVVIFLIFLVGGGMIYGRSTANQKSPPVWEPTPQSTKPHPEADELPHERDESVYAEINSQTEEWWTVWDIFGGDPDEINNYFARYGIRHRPASKLITNQADALGQGSAGQASYNIFTGQPLKNGLYAVEATARVGLDYGVLGDQILGDIEVNPRESGEIDVTVNLYGCIIGMGIPIPSLENPNPESDQTIIAEPGWWTELRFWIQGVDFNKNLVHEIAGGNAAANGVVTILENDGLHSDFKVSVTTPGENHAYAIIRAIAIGAGFEYVQSWCADHPEKSCPNVGDLIFNINIVAKDKPASGYLMCGFREKIAP